MQQGWQLYMLQTAAGMIYTGITTDVHRRLQLHQCGKGARALRGKGPLTLLYNCEAGDRAAASRLEYQVKQLSRTQKLLLVAQQPSCLHAWFNRSD